MGLLRLLFALSVLLAHAGLLFGYNIVSSLIAVQSFFIISGFYMAFILDKKYTKKNALFLFWSNRVLRILPLYWLMLILVFSFSLLKYFLNIGTADNAIIHYLKWSPDVPLYIFSIDLLNYIFRNVTLVFTLDYFRVNDSTPGYLLVQQAWTLQLELLFYFIVPFLTRLSRTLFLLLFFVYFICFFGLIVPANLLQPNLFSLFLNNLIFFLLGMISYQFIYTYVQKYYFSMKLLQGIFFVFLFYILFYAVIPLKFPLWSINMPDTFYYGVLFLVLPFIFLYSKSNTLDNFIGKLSYPVYIIHFFMVKLFSNLVFFQNPSNLRTVLVVIMTLFTSFLAVKFLEAPIDQFRQKRIKR